MYPVLASLRPHVRSATVRCGGGGGGGVSALEEPCPPLAAPPAAEPLRQHCAGSAERTALALELTALCRQPAAVPLVVGGARCEDGKWATQAMPFDHRRAAAQYVRATPEAVQRAFSAAAAAQRGWERTPVPERCAVFERAADLLAGAHRQRVVAAAMVGTAATAGRAELDVRQLIDQIRVDCHYVRDLTRGRCVFDGGAEARNANQYHGLEGFWAAVSPSDSVAGAAQLALAPALVGNGVVWKPSERAALSAHRVLKALLAAGLPAGVINFVPCDEGAFLEAAVARVDLAGVAFGGKTRVLERVWRRVGENVERFARFPRVVGCGDARNFHVVHSSADLAAAAAGTARAAFEMAGQKATGCSRAFVARSVLERFEESLVRIASTLVVSHPLDYRCFVSALASRGAWDAAAAALRRARRCGGVRVACGGLVDRTVGYYVQPTVLVAGDARHWTLREAVRAPLVVLHGFPDADLAYLEWAVAQAPYAMSGSVYAQDVRWARGAVGALRDAAATLSVNARCSELQPGQQSLGGSRKSGNGAKVGSISCLLQYCSERSLREVARPCADVTYPYMDEYMQIVLPQVGSISCLLQYCSERSLREVTRPCADVTYPYMDECPRVPYLNK